MVLAEYFHDAVFFDIETDGYFNRVTAVSALHRGTLRSFAKNENLESFADLLEEAELLVSFNGISFDLPVLARHFHLPKIPIPHIDLRWILHQEGIRGGLKKIEAQFGIERPSDIRGLNGMDAVTLWYRWNEWKDTEALHILKRYCSADVVSLAILFSRLMEKKNIPFQTVDEGRLWGLLP